MRRRAPLAAIALLMLSTVVDWPTSVAQGPLRSSGGGSQPAAPTAREIDPARVKVSGIRRLDSKYLTLYTDLPSSPEVDRLPAIFDQAYPQWCQYFARPELAERPWHTSACLMKNQTRFTAAGLLPGDLPEFLNGYTRDREMWFNEQSSDYYRRHLLLHEGTHAFMFMAFGTCGPPWYMEGMAELLATHSLVNGKLRSGWFPSRREDVPMWGRVKLVQDGLAAGRRLSIDDMLALGPQAHLKAEAYGWSWALAAFLDGHPRYRDRFRQLPTDLRQDEFNGRFRERFSPDWSKLNDEWRLFIAHIDYGYDLKREAIEFTSGQPLPDGGKKVSIAADRGWQSSGVRVEAGREYRLTAAGRFQVADKPRAWWCEPGGVSIRYVGGRPLGVLLAAVREEPGEKATIQKPSPLAGKDRARDTAADDSRASGAVQVDGGFLTPVVVGLGTTLVPKQTGTLYLRVNDSPAELADNAGSLDVKIERAKRD